jgi:hypothetical protein
MPFKRVVECRGASDARLFRWRNNTPAQQWYFDGVSKTIRSQQWKGNSLTIDSNGRSTNLRCTASNSRWW